LPASDPDADQYCYQHPHEHAEPNTDHHPDRNADGDAHPHRHADAHRHEHSDGDAHFDRNPN
jgi:hypothetical protein